jgi:predicted ABC-type sugar transport system permease subunit
MIDLLTGLIALALAVAYVGTLATHVPSVPLWIVIAIGVVLMVASLIDSLREEGGPGA